MGGPKRAAHIIQAFALRKGKDNVRKYAVRREIKRDDKTYFKSTKIQRLVTEKRLRRKIVNKRVKKERWTKSKEAHVAYEKLLSKYLKEKKAADKTPAAPVKEAKKAAPAAPAKAPKKK